MAENPADFLFRVTVLLIYDPVHKSSLRVYMFISPIHFVMPWSPCTARYEYMLWRNPFNSALAFPCMYFVVTTPVNRQYDGMWEVQWAVETCKVIKTRYKGLFLIDADADALQKIRDYETTAVYRVIPLDAVVKADLSEIVKKILDVAQEKLKKDETFAVRCRRRGFHISSKEIENKVGSTIVEAFENPVNLDEPEKVVLIEIIDRKAGISVIRPDEILRKDVIDL